MTNGAQGTRNSRQSWPYEDIVHLTRPVSAHPPMPQADRAAQFSPFAALSGHEDAVNETAKRAEEEVLSSEHGEAYESC